jgi:GTPase
LNRVLRHALEMNPPAQKGKRLPKIYFASQVATEPPTIILFTNGPDLFDDIYRRYLIKHFRDQLPYSEVPIKLDFRARQGGKDVRDELDEPLADGATPAKAEPKKAKPLTKPKPRRVGRKKKEQKSGLWEV